MKDRKRLFKYFLAYVFSGRIKSNNRKENS